MVLCLWYTYNNVGWMCVCMLQIDINIKKINWYKYNKVAIILLQADMFKSFEVANSIQLINDKQ